MASRGTRKAGTHRMDGAIAALTPLGFSKRLIRDTIKELIKAYGDNDAGWYFVEENYYKMVIDKIIEEPEGENEENEAAAAIETCGQSLLELEAGGSSNRDASSLHGRAPIKLEDSDMDSGMERSQSNASPAQKRRPCYGWISEEED